MSTSALTAKTIAALIFRILQPYRSTLNMMFAAVPWHWWLGAGLLLASLGAVISLVGGYLKAVEAKKHPTRAQRRAQQQPE